MRPSGYDSAAARANARRLVVSLKFPDRGLRPAVATVFAAQGRAKEEQIDD